MKTVLLVYDSVANKTLTIYINFLIADAVMQLTAKLLLFLLSLASQYLLTTFTYLGSMISTNNRNIYG